FHRRRYTSDLDSYPTRRSSDLTSTCPRRTTGGWRWADERGRGSVASRSVRRRVCGGVARRRRAARQPDRDDPDDRGAARGDDVRSEEHTSELQSREKLVCRLLL